MSDILRELYIIGRFFFFFFLAFLQGRQLVIFYLYSSSEKGLLCTLSPFQNGVSFQRRPYSDWRQQFWHCYSVEFFCISFPVNMPDCMYFSTIRWEKKKSGFGPAHWSIDGLQCECVCVLYQVIRSSENYTKPKGLRLYTTWFGLNNFSFILEVFSSYIRSVI